MVGEKTKQILTLYERIGRVLLETFEVRGDEFTRPDNVAISMIRDLIEEIDPKVIDKLVRERTRKRTKRERLP